MFVVEKGQCVHKMLVNDFSMPLYDPPPPNQQNAIDYLLNLY